VRRDTVIVIAVAAAWTIVIFALAEATQLGYVDHETVEPSDARRWASFWWAGYG
jgi:hypothetical protein